MAVALVGLGLKISPLLVGLPLAVVVLVASLGFAPLRRTVPQRDRRAPQETASYRWSRAVQAHPWRAVLGGSAALLVLAAVATLASYTVRLST